MLKPDFQGVRTNINIAGCKADQTHAAGLRRGTSETRFSVGFSVVQTTNMAHNTPPFIATTGVYLYMDTPINSFYTNECSSAGLDPPDAADPGAAEQPPAVLQPRPGAPALHPAQGGHHQPLY